MHRVAVMVSALAIAFSATALSARPTFGASTSSDARGEVSCTMSGRVKFSPPLKTVAQSVVASFRAGLSCPTGATGQPGVTVSGGTIKGTVAAASLSCANATLPGAAATVTWHAKGGSVNRSTIAWSSGTIDIGASAVLDFPDTGTTDVTGSYAGMSAVAHIVSDSGPGQPCTSKTGWRGFKFSRRSGASTFAVSLPTFASACGSGGTPPTNYDSVVVFSFENRTWNSVGGVGYGSALPYLHSLGQQCAFFSDWTETDTTQNSLTQYTGQVTGARQPGTVNDCSPSLTCSTTADNIFRQARVAGKTAINYVEGATTGCSAAGNAARHVPALYMWDTADRANCDAQVRPYSQFDPNNLPNFAFVTPTLCNDGHDCGNSTVDLWAEQNIQPVLDSAAYQAGHVAVFVWYDEDRPVPNLWITPTANAGPQSVTGAGYAGTLAAWESMLGFPCLANACTAPDMRTPANS